MPDNKIQFKTYKNWITGLVNVSPEGDSNTPITAVVDCENVDFTEFGTIKKRLGYAILGDEVTGSGGPGDTARILGLHYFGYQDQMLVTHSDSLYMFVVGSDTSWTSVGSGLSVKNIKREFANALTYCWFTDATGTPQRFDGTDMTDSGAGTSPDNNRPESAYYVQFHQNRLFYGTVVESDSSVYGSRYRYSGLRAIEGADAWDIDAYFDVEEDDGNNITGLRKYRNNLVVAKNNSLHMLKGTSNIDFGQFTYDTVHGCISNRTMREVDELFLFLTPRGIYSFDGIETKPFSENIRSSIDNIEQNLYIIRDSAGIYYDNKYLCAVPFGTYNDRILVYNTLSKSWTLYNDINASDFAIYTPDDAQQKLYFASSNERKVFELFSGNNDNGSDISAYFITTKFDCETPFLKKQFHTVWVYAEGDASDSLTINYRLDYDSAWTAFTSTFDLGNKIQKFSFPAGEKHKGRNIQFQVVNTSSYNFEFKGFTLSYEEVYPA